jgi:hypothetical protein
LNQKEEEGREVSTCLDLIKRSLRLIGVLGNGETPDNDSAQNARTVLNQMLGQWNNDKLLLYYSLRETFTVTANVYNYSIGSSQTWNTTRPIRIEQAFIRDSNNNDNDVEIISTQRYDQILDKSGTFGMPELLYYYATYPYGAIKLWPVPDKNYTIGLTQYKQFSEYSALNTTVSLPPGYEAAICYNLAVELSPEYGVQLLPIVIEKATEYKANIERINTPENIISVSDLSGISNSVTAYNIFTDE